MAGHATRATAAAALATAAVALATATLAPTAVPSLSPTSRAPTGAPATANEGDQAASGDIWLAVIFVTAMAILVALLAAAYALNLRCPFGGGGARVDVAAAFVATTIFLLPGDGDANACCASSGGRPAWNRHTSRERSVASME